jgi:lipopolysaccharide transport system permease protein
VIRNLREIYQYRALLLTMTARELKARYRASVLGFLWTFLNPTLNMMVFTVVGGLMMGAAVPKYPFFLFVGQLPWIYFSTSVMAGASAISDRRDLLTKVRFPAQVLPAVVVLTNLANYLLALPLLVGLGLFFHDVPSWHVVYFVPIVVVQTVFTLAVVYAVSALNVNFRDLQHIVANLMTMMFFLTPIIWPIEGRPQWIQDWVHLNPMATLTLAYRDIFYLHRPPNGMALLSLGAVSLVLLWMTTVLFESRREEFAELV